MAAVSGCRNGGADCGLRARGGCGGRLGGGGAPCKRGGCGDAGGRQCGRGVLSRNCAAAGGACHGGQTRRRCFLADGFGAGVGGGGRVGHLSVRHDDAKLHHPHRTLARRGRLVRAHYRRRLHRARCADSCGGGAGIVGAFGCGVGGEVSGCFGGGKRDKRQPEKGFLPFSGCLEPCAQQSCTPYAMRATLACV